jgi:hypothetical protein
MKSHSGHAGGPLELHDPVGRERLGDLDRWGWCRGVCRLRGRPFVAWPLAGVWVCDRLPRPPRPPGRVAKVAPGVS